MFHYGAIMNTLNIHVQVFVETLFSFLEYILRSGIVGSYGNSVFIFEELPNCFQSYCIILNSHQECIRAPISLHFFQHLLLFIFFMLAILVDVKRFSVHTQTSFCVLQKHLIQLLYILCLTNTNTRNLRGGFYSAGSCSWFCHFFF